jgi:hypothetical protein
MRSIPGRGEPPADMPREWLVEAPEVDDSIFHPGGRIIEE